MNLQKINNNTVVPALVLRGCRREGRAALPRPRGAESLGFGAVSVLTRSSVARGGLTTPHISHPGVSRAGYPALPGRPQAPAPAGAAPCPRPSPGDCGMGNSGPFLILTYPRAPIHPLPKAAVCAGRPRGDARGRLTYGSCMCPAAGPNTATALCVCAGIPVPGSPASWGLCPPGTAPDEPPGPWLRFHREWKERHPRVSLILSPSVSPHLRGALGYFPYRGNIAELLPPATQ